MDKELENGNSGLVGDFGSCTLTIKTRVRIGVVLVINIVLAKKFIQVFL